MYLLQHIPKLNQIQVIYITPGIDIVTLDGINIEYFAKLSKYLATGASF